MRNLINLIENIVVESDEDTAFMDREKNIEALIRFAFDKIGLTVNYNNYSVNYEDATREAEVTLEDNSVPLTHLLRLQSTGLADGDYNVRHGHDALHITFVVAPDLDHARLPDK